MGTNSKKMLGSSTHAERERLRDIAEAKTQSLWEILRTVLWHFIFWASCNVPISTQLSCFLSFSCAGNLGWSVTPAASTLLARHATILPQATSTRNWVKSVAFVPCEFCDFFTNTSAIDMYTFRRSHVSYVGKKSHTFSWGVTRVTSNPLRWRGRLIGRHFGKGL